MKRTTEDYLKILGGEIHSAVFATVDENGRPMARVIDIMLTDQDSLYFLTATGKGFYRQLKEQEYVAISGMTQGQSSPERRAVSVRGRVRELGSGLLDEIFEKNPYMASIYPEKESREALTVFQLYEGEGEYFDLSTTPITRYGFFLGEKAQSGSGEESGGYRILSDCNGCGDCVRVCPQKCIVPGKGEGNPLFMIQKEHCLHCGNCKRACGLGAVAGPGADQSR